MDWSEFLALSRTTKKGRFYCDICERWITKHRWAHYRVRHQYLRYYAGTRKQGADECPNCRTLGAKIGEECPACHQWRDGQLALTTRKDLRSWLTRQ